MNDTPQSKRSSGLHWAVWLVVLIVLFGVLVLRSGTPENQVDWTVGAPALAEAGEPNKPVLLYFTADWCGPCQAMKKQVWPEDRVATAVNTSTLPVYVDVDDPNNAPLSQGYEVRAIPTFILIDRGRVLTRLEGYLNADQVIALATAANEKDAGAE